MVVVFVQAVTLIIREWSNARLAITVVRLAMDLGAINALNVILL